MGRRSINTTKSGKYMNPTDQARKEARKRELKKNKKQRMLVRTAVLKGKDPHQVLADMERLDQMEFNVDSPPPLNEKVLRDKRRKLKETWDRLCRLYVKEDHEKYLELKRLEADYESKRNQLIKFYESVKSAQEVALDEIPLPTGPPEQNSEDEAIEEEPESEPSSILKKTSVTPIVNKDPPGLPPGPPPSLDEIDDGDINDDDEEEEEQERNKKVHFGDNEKEADINEFLKEIEDVEKTVAENDKNVPESPEDTNNPSESNLSESETSISSTGEETTTILSKESTIIPTNINTTSSTTPVSSVSINPSTSLTSTIPPTQNTPILTMAPTKIQPAPPPIPPPVLLLRPPLMPGKMRPNMPPPNSIPPPRLGMGHPRPQRHGGGGRGGHQRDRNQNHKNRNEEKSKIQSNPPHIVSDKATIEAKPQLRNLSADAIRFTPLSLKIRRNEKNPKKPGKPEGQESNFSFTSNPYNEQFKQQQPTKDDAYAEFMRELKDII